MVYVPPELHRAVKHLALEDRRSASDLYVEAAYAYLASRGLAVPTVPAPDDKPAEPSPTVLADLIQAVERHGRQLEEILRQDAEPQTEDVESGAPSRSAGMTTAQAMGTLLRIVRAAGSVGITSHDLRSALEADGIKSGTAEVAKAALRKAGIMRFEERRWYVDDA